MKFRSVFRVLPVPVFYVAQLPKDVFGRAKGPFIQLLKGLENDEAAHQHELTHVRQFYLAWLTTSALLAMTLAGAALFFRIAPQAGAALGAIAAGIAHPVLYTFMRSYRYDAEAAAYEIQTRYPDASGSLLTLNDAAGRLAGPMYDLGITQAQALKEIAKHLPR